jgi:hypothetical protein
MADKKDIEKALQQRRCWISLTGLGSSKIKDTTENSSEVGNNTTTLSPDEVEIATSLTAKARALASDAIACPELLFTERLQRLSLSVRDLEEAKKQLLSKALIKLVWVGKGLLLAPTSKLYAIMGLPSPYKRNVSEIHSFLVLVAERLIKPNPLVKSTRREVPIGDDSSALDLFVQMKNGQQWAYEIVHHTISNVSSAAAKLQGKGFAQICFVCSDHNQREAVRASIKNTGFDPDFTSIIRYTIFSSLMRQRKQMKLRDIR